MPNNPTQSSGLRKENPDLTNIPETETVWGYSKEIIQDGQKKIYKFTSETPNDKSEMVSIIFTGDMKHPAKPNISGKSHQSKEQDTIGIS